MATPDTSGTLSRIRSTPHEKRLRALRCFGFLSLCLLAVGCKIGRPEPTTAAWTVQQARELRQAGERLGVPVRTEGMAGLTEGSAALFAAPAVNLETVPAARYAEGVDLGVAYFDLPGPLALQGSSSLNVPKGFYKLRVFTDKGRQPEDLRGHLELIDAQGRTVVVLPTDDSVPTLAVASEPGTHGVLSLVTGGNVAVPYVNTHHGGFLVFRVCFCCVDGDSRCFFVFVRAPR